MARALQLAAAAMAAEQLRLDAIAHNIANVDTAGFRRVLLAADAGETIPVYRRDQPEASLGTLATEPSRYYLALDPRPGANVVTRDPYDLAIDGDGFLMMQGGRLSRGGRLGVDAEGYLTISGVRVEGASGPVRVGTDQIEIKTDGTVQAKGNTVGRLRIVSIPTASLEPMGGGLYMVKDPSGLREGGGSVRQGMRERSSVNPMEEMVEMINGLRAYETAQRVMQAVDETTARLIEQVGRLG
ncbi:MAG: hypothetical protein HY660_06615 [Armatimonadetes bacterium]|nr:hypothetical protein [Armatimonadota bacterium]